MRFDGDIVITDPCYVMIERKWWEHPDYPKWDDFHIGFDGEVIRNYTPLLHVGDTWQQKINKALFETNTEMMREAKDAFKKANPELCKDDWKLSRYGANMEVLGFTTYLTSDTGYGDWGCTTYECGTNKILGEFCADAGVVSVMLLREVLAYNPQYNHTESKRHCVTLIPDFHGEVYILNDFKGGVKVIGKGSVDFYTKQTSL